MSPRLVALIVRAAFLIVMLSAITLCAIKLNVVFLNVVAPINADNHQNTINCEKMKKIMDELNFKNK
jgi:hypothetical protein